MSPPSVPNQRQIRRKRFSDYPPAYWADVTSTVSTVTAAVDSKPVTAEAELPTVSDTPVCHTCNQIFATFVLQREHFRTDWHKYNLHRRVRGHVPLSEDDFDALSDLGSVESLSGSESEVSDEDTTHDESISSAAPTARLAEKLEFRDPHSEADSFLVVYRAALPDQASLASLALRGSWAVIMAGGGHFCAAIWDTKGVMVRHKTFHRYTSRRKQGGSQAAADEARGAANRIKSAGATLRRYGEQALQKEVHALLKDWEKDFSEVQCIFVRASQRERRDLLIGWTGTPLKAAQEKEAIRNIPIPTRRATLKEAQRVYEELSTIQVSSISLVESIDVKTDESKEKVKTSSAAKSSQPALSKKPAVKGTDHLKRRDEKEKKANHAEEENEKVEEPTPEVDEELVRLLKLVMANEKEVVLQSLSENTTLRSVVFERHYFSDDERFEKLEEAIGLIGVASVCGHGELVEKLLDAGVSPAVGASPYVMAKAKAMRMLLRKYWGAHPDRYDYTAAGIPSPLGEAELKEIAEREKVRRKREREKKKEKAREKVEAAKPPEQRAREQRAAAAEARRLGNRCASCKKSLEGVVPFQRLAYKYCSTDCVSRHRQVLSNM